MQAAKIAFSGPTGQLLNYCSDIRGLQITRSNVGRYTVQFFTSCYINESKVASPIITVTCQSPSGTATVTNVLNPRAVYQKKSQDGYHYQISFQIEVQNVATTLPGLLGSLLGFLVTQFVDRAVVMVDCEMSERAEDIQEENSGEDIQEENSGEDIQEENSNEYYSIGEVNGDTINKMLGDMNSERFNKMLSEMDSETLANMSIEVRFELKKMYEVNRTEKAYKLVKKIDKAKFEKARSSNLKVPLASKADAYEAPRTEYVKQPRYGQGNYKNKAIKAVLSHGSLATL